MSFFVIRKTDGGKTDHGKTAGGKSAAPAQEPVRRKKLPVVEADPEIGLTQEQVHTRIKAGYQNTAVESNSKSLKEIVLSNVVTYFNMIFFVLAAAIIAVGAWYNPDLHVRGGSQYHHRHCPGVAQQKEAGQPESAGQPQGQRGPGWGGTHHLRPRHGPGRHRHICRRGSDLCRRGGGGGECLVNESLLTGEADELRKVPGDKLLSGSFWCPASALPG